MSYHGIFWFRRLICIILVTFISTCCFYVWGLSNIGRGLSRGHPLLYQHSMPDNSIVVLSWFLRLWNPLDRDSHLDLRKSKTFNEESFHALPIARHARALWSCLVPVHWSFRWIGVLLAAWCHITWPQTKMTFKSGPTKVCQDTTKFPLMVSEVLPRSTSRYDLFGMLAWVDVHWVSFFGYMSNFQETPALEIHSKHTTSNNKQTTTTQTTLWRPFQVLKHKCIKYKLIIDVYWCSISLKVPIGHTS